jgi:hypothetical protein
MCCFSRAVPFVGGTKINAELCQLLDRVLA